MKKLFIFGTGTVSEYILKKLDKDKVDIIGFVKTEYKPKEIFHGFKVYSLNDITKIDYDYILIASGYVQTIRDILIKANIPLNKIISFIFDDGSCLAEIKTEIDNFLNNKYNRNKLLDLLHSEDKISSFFPAVVWKEEVSLDKIEKDFVREQTVRMLSDQIHHNNLSGDVIELGVFRGDFTVVLSRYFNDRNLYLYDTFDGFSEKDIINDDTIQNKIGEFDKFKNTSVDFVLSRIKHKKNILIRKGYFPDSFQDFEKHFCFVSIDFNLYSPVLSALELLYPLLVKGGYMMISDYNAPFYSGTRKAVDEFCEKYNKTIIPVADFYGSALLLKE